MSQINARILHRDYLLACPDGKEDVLSQAVALVNEAITQQCQSGKMPSREQAVVLVALNLAFEGQVQQMQLQLLQTQINALQQQIADTAALLTTDGCFAMQAQLNALLMQNMENHQRSQRLMQRLDQVLAQPVAVPPALAEEELASSLAQPACPDANTQHAGDSVFSHKVLTMDAITTA